MAGDLDLKSFWAAPLLYYIFRPHFTGMLSCMEIVSWCIHWCSSEPSPVYPHLYIRLPSCHYIPHILRSLTIRLSMHLLTNYLTFKDEPLFFCTCLQTHIFFSVSCPLQDHTVITYNHLPTIIVSFKTTSWHRRPTLNDIPILLGCTPQQMLNWSLPQHGHSPCSSYSNNLLRSAICKYLHQPTQECSIPPCPHIPMSSPIIPSLAAWSCLNSAQKVHTCLLDRRF